MGRTQYQFNRAVRGDFPSGRQNFIVAMLAVFQMPQAIAVNQRVINARPHRDLQRPFNNRRKHLAGVQGGIGKIAPQNGLDGRHQRHTPHHQHIFEVFGENFLLTGRV